MSQGLNQSVTLLVSQNYIASCCFCYPFHNFRTPCQSHISVDLIRSVLKNIVLFPFNINPSLKRHPVTGKQSTTAQKPPMMTLRHNLTTIGNTKTPWNYLEHQNSNPMHNVGHIDNICHEQHRTIPGQAKQLQNYLRTHPAA